MRKLSNRWKSFISLILVVLILAVLGELTTRAVWAVKGLGFLNCQRNLHQLYYPELDLVIPLARKPGQENPYHNFDVLILGASVFNPHIGPIPVELMERLSYSTGNWVQIFNAAQGAHTMLDSYYKYKHLADREYDLVIVYHGINDVRINNCPPDWFRPKYGHYAWYRELNAIEDGSLERILALPITLKLAWLRLEARLGLVNYVGREPIPKEFYQYGSNIRTTETFRESLEGIVALAGQRGQTVLLMTYASYIPPDYDEMEFRAHKFDYYYHWFPVEVWGAPENVKKGLDAHNEIIRDVARNHPDHTLFIDVARAMPRVGHLFNDVCHFSTEGATVFVNKMVGTIAPYAISQRPEYIFSTDVSEKLRAMGPDADPQKVEALVTSHTLSLVYNALQLSNASDQ